MFANDNEKDLGVATFIRKDFYVANGLRSVESVQDAVTLVKNTKEMFKRGGFKLLKFTSSDKKVIEALPTENRAKGI